MSLVASQEHSKLPWAISLTRMYTQKNCDQAKVMLYCHSGYMAPEYAMRGLYSIKSDVFSFGVLLLEIVTGRRNNGLYDSEHDVDLLNLVSVSDDSW